MSQYTKSTNFATKDNLTPGDPLKIVRGTEIDTEFNNIATAIATKTDNASAAITGGTINDTTIGATTASTGAFTTISATGAITSTLATGTAPLVVASTTKVTNLNVDSLDGADWASPAALGSTTPAAVSATTLSASGNVTLSGGTANGVAYLNGSKVVTSGTALVFDGTNLGVGTSSPSQKLSVNNSTGVNTYAAFTNSNATNGNYVGTAANGDGVIGTIDAKPLLFLTGASTRATLDSSGNLGLGVTPSAWFSTRKVAQIGNASLAGITGSDGWEMRSNAYVNTSGSELYLNNGNAALYASFNGQHRWYTAPSGTAGNAITFTQAMTLNASGNLGIGTTSPNVRTEVSGSEAIVSLRVNTENAGVSSSNYSQIQLSDVGTVRAYWRNVRDGSGNTHFAYNSILSFLSDAAGTPTERARIDSSGRLLVGTTTTSFGSRITSFNDASYTFESQRTTTASEGHIAFTNANGAVGSIFTSGTTTSFNTSSDYRLKNITGPVTNSGAYIDSLNPVEGTWKADGSTFVGLIAHEAQEASRTVVATGVKDGEEMQGMDYSSAEIIANLIAEIQSLRKRLADAGI
jgi:hypothetical protein